MMHRRLKALPLEDEIPGEEPRSAIVNTSLIIANIAVFFVGLVFPWVLVPGARTYQDVIVELGMIPGLIIAGERLYTIFTAMFLHGSLAHLFGNMLYLYIFGDNIENVMGRVKYLVFYVLSGVGAAVFHIASILFMPREALVNAVLTSANPWMIPAVGASGAISGVLAAYLILFPVSQLRVVTLWGPIPVFLQLPASVYIAFWFIYQLVMGLTVSFTGVNSGVAFWAHIGGFLTGAALTPIFARERERRRAHDLIAARL